MAIYSKILMPYDGSESSKNALRQALALYKTGGVGELHIITVAQVPEVAVELVGMADFEGMVTESADRILNEAVEIAKADGVKAIAAVKKGVPYEVVVDYAEWAGCDLIVVGRRGVRRLERMLIGSVSSRIIGHTKKDVLVVPRGGSVGKCAHLLLATDGSLCSEGALDRALRFAAHYKGASLHAVAVVDTNDEFMAIAPKAAEKVAMHYKDALDKVLSRAKSAGLKAVEVVHYGDAPEAIVKTAKDVSSDIIFVGTHGRTGMRRLMMGSAAEHIIGLSPVPVLISKAR